MLTQIITYISNISWQQRRSKKRKTMPHSSSWTQNTAGDTKILKVESPEISPTSARNNRRQDEGSSWGKSLKLLNITPRLFEERSILSFVGSHQWTSPSSKLQNPPSARHLAPIAPLMKGRLKWIQQLESIKQPRTHLSVWSRYFLCIVFSTYGPTSTSMLSALIWSLSG